MAANKKESADNSWCQPIYSLMIDTVLREGFSSTTLPVNLGYSPPKKKHSIREFPVHHFVKPGEAETIIVVTIFGSFTDTFASFTYLIRFAHPKITEALAFLQGSSTYNVVVPIEPYGISLADEFDQLPVSTQSFERARSEGALISGAQLFLRGFSERALAEATLHANLNYLLNHTLPREDVYPFALKYFPSFSSAISRELDVFDSTMLQSYLASTAHINIVGIASCLLKGDFSYARKLLTLKRDFYIQDARFFASIDRTSSWQEHFQLNSDKMREFSGPLPNTMFFNDEVITRGLAMCDKGTIFL